MKYEIAFDLNGSLHRGTAVRLGVPGSVAGRAAPNQNNFLSVASDVYSETNEGISGGANTSEQRRNNAGRLSPRERDGAGSFHVFPAEP